MNFAGRELIECDELLAELSGGRAQIIDVRAPVEFLAGKIPQSTNCPILNDEERAQVGTVYKNEGSDSAVKLGHSLVQGAVKDQRLAGWVKFAGVNPEQTFITCFRGGMRSRLAQCWMKEAGVLIPRLNGGYKKMRNCFVNEVSKFSEHASLLVLSGKTGAGKTQVLESAKNFPLLDLENLAKHRGSAFGATGVPQPTQIDFENELALRMHGLRSETRKIVVEDESRMIGERVLPETLFTKMRLSPVVTIDEPLEARVENTFREYVLARKEDPKVFLSHRESLFKIKDRLGGLRYQEVLQDMSQAESNFRQHGELSAAKVWVEKLLVWYYDPLYERSFLKRKPNLAFAGTRREVMQFLEG